MKNKLQVHKVLAVAFMAFVVLIIVLAGCKTQSPAETEATETASVASESSTTTSTTEVQLSEQPDKAKYEEYFKDFYIGKLPPGEQANPFNIPEKTTVFTSQDQFCTVGELKKTIPSGSLAIAIYDRAAGQDLNPKAVFPVELKSGGFMGNQPLDFPTGKYEYKLYVDDVLAINIPFEVK
jgi:hypothetical protein